MIHCANVTWLGSVAMQFYKKLIENRECDEKTPTRYFRKEDATIGRYCKH